DGKLPRVWLSNPSRGLDHQVTARLSAPAATAEARLRTPSLVASHRVRVTDWFQASWWVPASNSRATRGAPQKAPITAGARATTKTPVQYRLWSVRVSRSKRFALVRASRASRGPVTESTMASAATPARTVTAWTRNCRQVSQIIGPPPRLVN